MALMSATLCTPERGIFSINADQYKTPASVTRQRRSQLPAVYITFRPLSGYITMIGAISRTVALYYHYDIKSRKVRALWVDRQVTPGQ